MLLVVVAGADRDIRENIGRVGWVAPPDAAVVGYVLVDSEDVLACLRVMRPRHAQALRLELLLLESQLLQHLAIQNGRVLSVCLAATGVSLVYALASFGSVVSNASGQLFRTVLGRQVLVAAAFGLGNCIVP